MITGAASGIGRAIARAFADDRLFLLDIDRAGLDAVAAEIGGSPVLLPTDLRDPEAIDRAFAEVRARAGHLDALVNSAGVAFPDRIDLPDTSAWDALIEVNLLSGWLCCRNAIPLLVPGRGIVVNVSSTAGARPMKYQAVYSATKAGMDALSEALREELRARGVRVTAVSPGPTRTGILRHFPREFIEAHRIEEEPRIEAEDVARLVRFIVDQPPGVCIDCVVVTPTLWGYAP
jgi:NADP-dependent 3-hydroxy acid dehydrogenase YdfG